MRLDYVPNPPTNLSPEDQEVLERVKARRGAMGLIALDLTLLHAPKIADGKLRSLQIVRLIDAQHQLTRLECAARSHPHQKFLAR